jgi:SAM-dependent methyltransferase
MELSPKFCILGLAVELVASILDKSGQRSVSFPAVVQRPGAACDEKMVNWFDEAARTYTAAAACASLDHDTSEPLLHHGSRWSYFTQTEWVEYVDAQLEGLRPEYTGAGSVLELGCGIGAFAFEVFRRFPAASSYVGIDLSLEAVGVARTVLASHACASFGVGDLRSLPFATGSFQHVFAPGCLTYVPTLEDVRVAVLETLRVLAPGEAGCACISGVVVLTLLSGGKYN